MTARMHHYVPQCYLKGFAEDPKTPKLFVFDAKKRCHFSTHPANLAIERDFHRIDVDERAPDALENGFSEFESRLSEALERIIAAHSIEVENDRALLFNLLGLLAVKNPRRREMMRLFLEHKEKVIMDLATSSPERWKAVIKGAKASGFVANDADEDYKKMRDSIQKEQYKIIVQPMRHLQIELANFDKILPYLFYRKWLLLKAPQNTTGFITSDHPMCLMWSDPASPVSYGPGLGCTGTEIWFPISSNLAIIGSFEGEEEEIEASDWQISAINGAFIAFAERQVYARDCNFIYLDPISRKIKQGAELLKDTCFVRPRP